MLEHVGQERNDRTRRDCKSPMQKGILRFIVRRLDRFLKANRVDNRRRGGDVDNLHDAVVDRVEISQQIQIASDKDNKKEFMCPNRDS